ncbi:histidine--tRNA ligase [uncultured Agrococcus sp.]|uniref:histidine--tRNA ligase n=1 Tax=uncultured Agrococcus sp. TaxID=382258 RepID=UPI0025D321B1|nr:histidine--tRNA ligase [uncultured Agrococcus sp.]
MAQNVVPPRGMRDFLPAQKRQRERVLQTIREAFSDHGFSEIETPVMEDAARLHAGLGGDNEKLAFAVMRRGLGPDDLRTAENPLDLADLGLRFDLTVPLARFIATNRGSLPPVFRSIQIAPVWRAERPQKGRYRQFIQCDIDISGEAGIVAELELLTATGDALRRLGLTDAFIRVNDRRLLFAVLDAASVPAEQQERALITVDKLDKIGDDGVVAELTESGLDGERVMGIIRALAAGQVPDDIDESALAAIRDLLDADCGVRLEFDPSLVRGMGYYTGAIFEIAHPELSYSIGGGGRYDGMIGRFSGTDVPAAGISFGFERLVDLVDIAGDGTETVGLVVDKKVPAQELVATKRSLVESGRKVLVANRARNVQSVLEQLSALGATHFAFVRPGDSADALEIKPLD